MAHAKPENKPVRISLSQRFLSRSHRKRITRVNIRDSSGDDDSTCSRKQQAGVRERFASYGFAEPNRAISEFLQFAGGLLHFRGRMFFKLPRPDPDRSKLYRRWRHR